jgi:Retroviral aspartyl protease
MRKLNVVLNRKPARTRRKRLSFKTETHENNVIDIDNFSDEFERLDELPEIQEFMDNMDIAVSTEDLPQNKVKQDTNPFPTTGLRLEVSVAVIISSENEFNSILLNKVLLDTGCTRTIIKRDKLPDKFFESQKQINEVSWTSNAGKFVTKYEIPLQFLLPEFAPSREINWSVAVDDTAQQSKYDMIIGRDLQIALGMDILFCTKHLKWDGMVIPMQTPEANLSYFDT